MHTSIDAPQPCLQLSKPPFSGTSPYYSVFQRTITVSPVRLQSIVQACLHTFYSYALYPGNPHALQRGPLVLATSLNPAVLMDVSANFALGGLEAECSHCGVTHTMEKWSRRGQLQHLWVFYLTLPSQDRAQIGVQATPRPKTVDVCWSSFLDIQRTGLYGKPSPSAFRAARCFIYYTTTTPL